jgi:hypothetical protein
MLSGIGFAAAVSALRADRWHAPDKKYLSVFLQILNILRKKREIDFKRGGIG